MIFFATEMIKCIFDVAVKLLFVVDGVEDNFIGKYVADLLLHHVYLELDFKRGDNIRRIAAAIFGAHATHATSTAVTAPPSLCLRASRFSRFFSAHPFSTTLLTTPPIPTPPAAAPVVDFSNVDVFAAQMVQENFDLLANYAGITAADRRARLRLECLQRCAKASRRPSPSSSCRSGLRNAIETPRTNHFKKRLQIVFITSAWTSRARKGTLNSASPRRTPPTWRLATSNAKLARQKNASSNAMPSSP